MVLLSVMYADEVGLVTATLSAMLGWFLSIVGAFSIGKH